MSGDIVLRVEHAKEAGTMFEVKVVSGCSGAGTSACIQCEGCVCSICVCQPERRCNDNPECPKNK